MNRKQKQLLLIAALCAVLFLAVYLLFGREDTGNGRSTLTGNASESQASANLFDRMLATNTADTSKTRLAPLAPKNAAVAEARTDRSTIDCPVIVKGMDGAMNAKRFQEKLRSKFEETDARLAALLQQVMQSSNPIEKAGASYLSLQMAYENSKNNFLKMHPGCEGNPVCEKELDASPTVPQQAIDEVAKLALNSRDPALYAMVFNMCNRYSWDEGYCSQINALQWANRDPENGAVWLHTLTHLQPESEGKDKDFIDNALFRLSTAKTFDAGFFSLAKLQGSQILSTSDPAIQARLQELSSHIWDNTPLPAYSRVVKACSGEMLNNGNRRHTCERITQQFLRERNFFIDYAIAFKMGGNLGWAPERLKTVQENIEAVGGMMIKNQKLEKEEQEKMLPALQRCQSYFKDIMHAEELARVGEFKRYQQMVGEQAETRAELIQIAKNSRAERERKAALEKSK